jgi:outer membrane receptor protein involved in Fe transport
MRRLFIVIFHSIFCALLLQAQPIIVMGTVADARTGEALIGANVRADDIGTSSNILGTYLLRINIESGQEIVIRCSYVGYQPKESVLLSVQAGDTIVQHFELSEGGNLLETATITSGRYRRSLGEVTVSLEVLPPALLEQSNAISLDEALEKIPSLTITDGQANIRGGSGYAYGAGSRVLLLIDDMPYLQGDAGFPNWNDIPVENIGQVEILKGAASALYGSSALNGVINIQTALPGSKPYWAVSALTRIYDQPRDTSKVWWNSDTLTRPYLVGLQASGRLKIGKNKNWDLVLGLNHTDEISFRQGDDTRYTRISAFNRWRLSPRTTIGLNVNVNTVEGGTFLIWSGYPKGALQPLAGSNTVSQSQRFTIDPRFTHFDQHGNRHRVLGRYFYVNNDVDLGNANQSDFLFGEYQFQRDFSSFGMVLTAGLTTSYTLSDAELYGDTLITAMNNAAYLQVEKRFFERLNVSAGVRYEHHNLNAPDDMIGDSVVVRSASEGKPVFRIGANYRLATATFLRASYGQGYRFPTITEKFVRTSVGPILQIFPNPDLVSEIGWSAEIGLRQGILIKDWSAYADFSAFWTEYNDMMEFVFGFNQLFGFASDNVGNTRIRGLELSLGGRGQMGAINLDFIGGYTYLDPVFRPFTTIDSIRSSADYNVLKYRHRHMLKGDVQLGWKRFEIGLSANMRTPFEAVDYMFVQDVVIPGAAAYRAENDHPLTTWDARIAVKIIKNLKLSFLVQNFTNFDLMIRPGIHEAPRAYNLRLDWKWD